MQDSLAATTPPVSSEAEGESAAPAEQHRGRPIPKFFPANRREQIAYIQEIFSAIPGAKEAIGALQITGDGAAPEHLSEIEVVGALQPLPDLQRIIGESRGDMDECLESIVHFAFNPDPSVPNTNQFNPHVLTLVREDGEKKIAVTEGVLGFGGYGFVVNARIDGDRVAVKTLFEPVANRARQDWDAVKNERRFAFEHTALGRAHDGGSGVVRVLGHAENQGHPSYEMESIFGIDLAQFTALVQQKVENGDEPPHKALYLMLASLIQSFADMHNPQGSTTLAKSQREFDDLSVTSGDTPFGIIHRDIKPSNVMLDLERGRPVIMDLGVGKDNVESTDETCMTMTGEQLGTVVYLSPEQVEHGSQHAGPESDVYSLGCTILHMLTGKPPFDGTRKQVEDAHINDFPNFDAIANPHVRELVKRMMNKLPENRAWQGDNSRPLAGVAQVFLEAFRSIATPEEWSKYQDFLSRTPDERTVLEFLPADLKNAAAEHSPTTRRTPSATLGGSAAPSQYDGLGRTPRVPRYVRGRRGQPVRNHFARRLWRSRTIQVISTIAGTAAALAVAAWNWGLFKADKLPVREQTGEDPVGEVADAGATGANLTKVEQSSTEVAEVDDPPEPSIEFSRDVDKGILDIASVTVVVDGKLVTVDQNELFRSFSTQRTDGASGYSIPSLENDGDMPHGYNNADGYAITYTPGIGYCCIDPDTGVVWDQSDSNASPKVFVDFYNNHIAPPPKRVGAAPKPRVSLGRPSSLPASVVKSLSDGGEVTPEAESAKQNELLTQLRQSFGKIGAFARSLVSKPQRKETESAVTQVLQK